MIKRNLDSTYFRVLRNGEWDNVCFSDLSLKEMEQVMSGRDVGWLKQMCMILGTALRAVGDRFEIYTEE